MGGDIRRLLSAPLLVKCPLVNGCDAGRSAGDSWPVSIFVGAFSSACSMRPAPCALFADVGSEEGVSFEKRGEAGTRVTHSVRGSAQDDHHNATRFVGVGHNLVVALLGPSKNLHRQHATAARRNSGSILHDCLWAPLAEAKNVVCDDPADRFTLGLPDWICIHHHFRATPGVPSLIENRGQPLFSPAYIIQHPALRRGEDKGKARSVENARIIARYRCRRQRTGDSQKCDDECDSHPYLRSI